MTSSYVFGTEQHEIDRLTVQGAFFHDITREFLIEAKIPGCREVLEIGCGVGEVTRILQDLMPTNGHITITDKEAPMVDATLARCAGGRVRVTGEVVNVDQIPTGAPRYDAIVGRLVLMYVPDVVATLARLRTLLRPGGIVAIQEADHRSYLKTDPPSPVYERYAAELNAATATKPVRQSLGLALRGLFSEAGLHAPVMSLKGRIDGGERSPVYEVLAGAYAGLTVPNADDRKAVTRRVADELRAEAVAHNLTVYSSRLIGVWARV